MKKQKQRYFRVTLPEVGLELVYDADASPPDDLTANQYELAKYVALYLSLHSLIETLETKKELAQEGFLKLAGKGIGYIRKRHGRKRKTKTIGATMSPTSSGSERIAAALKIIIFSTTNAIM